MSTAGNDDKSPLIDLIWCVVCKVKDRKLVVNAEDAGTVRAIFKRFLVL